MGSGDRNGCETCWCWLDEIGRQLPLTPPIKHEHTYFDTPPTDAALIKAVIAGMHHRKFPTEGQSVAVLVSVCVSMFARVEMCGVGACKEELHAPRKERHRSHIPYSTPPYMHVNEHQASMLAKCQEFLAEECVTTLCREIAVRCCMLIRLRACVCLCAIMHGREAHTHTHTHHIFKTHSNAPPSPR